MALPRPTQAQVAMRTRISTYFTKDDGTHLLFTAGTPTRVWLHLEDAGPVDFGLNENLQPVGKGAGAGLITGVPVEFTLNPGERLFIAATAKNRVAYIFSPIYGAIP